MAETEEILQTVEHLQGEFEDLAVRGLKASGPEHLAALETIRGELERVGAGHLAGRIAAVTEAIRNDDRAAAAALMRAQASLRLFERMLTLEAAADLLAGLLPPHDPGAES